MHSLQHLVSIVARALPLVAALPVPAALVVASPTLNTPIPDGNTAGINTRLTVDAPSLIVQDVKVSIEIQGTGFGAWNGDYYAALVHGDRRAVLLNRPGLSASNPVGYPDNGFQVTFDDAADQDIHTYRDSMVPSGLQPVTGTWQPDARGVLPSVVTTDSLRDRFLSVFEGILADGDWHLVLADTEFGGTGRLVRWSLEITAVPEPEPMLLAVGGVLMVVALIRRRAFGC